MAASLHTRPAGRFRFVSGAPRPRRRKTTPAGAVRRRSPVDGSPSAGTGGVRRSLAAGYRYLRHTRGYACVPVSASRRDRRRVASSWGDDARAWGPLAAGARADLALGNSVVAIGWRSFASMGSRPERRRRRVLAPLLCTIYSGRPSGWPLYDSYLVDSASSHMLVSKIKPCMSKYKQLYGETANGSLNQLSFI